MAEALPFYTIGHSNRTLAEFVALLQQVPVARLVDVRKIPMSRANPQFNGEAVGRALEALQIGYVHNAALGGLRGKTRDVPADLNGFWDNRSFHHYADYALTEAFREGLERLMADGAERVCAVMCSEAVWWRCHRRIIADYLLHAGRSVIHLMARDRSQPAKMTAVAVAVGPILHYPKGSDANVMKGTDSDRNT